MVSAPMFTPHSAGDPREAIVARWRRRSRVVGFWRIVLPLSIFAITLAMAGWIVARSLLENPVAAITAAERLVTNPRFYGRDKKDRTYLLTAMQAVEDEANKDKYTLKNPSFNLGGGSVRADQGVYIKNSTKILLHGKVVAVNSDGSRMSTEDAQIDTKTGVVTNTAAPHTAGMTLETSNAKISADDYSVAKNGVVTFHGRVHGVINGK